MVELTERHEQILAGAAIFVGTVDRAGNPEIGRVFGVKIHDDRRTVRVLLSEPWEAAIMANVRQGAWLALSFTEVTTYQSFQAKGKILRVEAASAEDRAIAAAHKEQFANNAISIGVHESTRKYAYRPTLAITFVIEQLFCQTPGPGAGDPVRGAS